MIAYKPYYIWKNNEKIAHKDSVHKVYIHLCSEARAHQGTTLKLFKWHATTMSLC